MTRARFVFSLSLESATRIVAYSVVSSAYSIAAGERCSIGTRVFTAPATEIQHNSAHRGGSPTRDTAVR